MFLDLGNPYWVSGSSIIHLDSLDFGGYKYLVSIPHFPNHGGFLNCFTYLIFSCVPEKSLCFQKNSRRFFQLLDLRVSVFPNSDLSSACVLTISPHGTAIRHILGYC